MQAHGADQVLILQTTPTLLQVPASDFFHQFVRGRLAAKVMVEGVNFGFGRDREGNVDMLRRLCQETKLQLIVVPQQDWNGIMVSSSRVRAALRQGRVRDAADMLGRCYSLRGTVVTGKQRGHTLGFPTANLEKIATLIPGDGVYAVRVDIGERRWPGAANVGTNPTFGEQERKLEVHIIGFQGDLVGKELTVEFVERLRETKAFPSVAQLIEQLRVDVEQAKNAVKG
jgi:riboflavin kinase/FMN adenylyltransferase